MKITITATDKLTTMEGVPVRVWDGVTEAGTKVHVFVHRIAVPINADCTAFERELKEQLPPGRVYDLRHIL